MNKVLTDSRLANLGANSIYRAFENYQEQFRVITLRAKSRFEQRDWSGVHLDAAERLNLYKKVVEQAVGEIQEMLGDRLPQKLVWAGIKAVYSGLIAGRDEWELAETFFNSITRRIFTTVGVDPQIEFVATDFDTPPTEPGAPVYRSYPACTSLTALIQTILEDFRFEIDYEDIERDARLVAQEIENCFNILGSLCLMERAEIIKPAFYRGKGAYIIGRICCGAFLIPLVLALHNGDKGVIVDAALLTEDEVGILFSFTRTYFHAETERPYDMVRFLKTIMPRKRIAELYTSIGHNKHGKTELYRDMLHHLASTEDKFEIARGQRGMVMVVFTMPSYDVVFKLIKDRFDYPKTTTRREVMAQYHLVFQHDRVGRLIDAQEFEHLKFDRKYFSEELLEELLQVASSIVKLEDDYVVIRHAYVERRVTPLDIFLREEDEVHSYPAVMDFGNTIKDLAAVNIFPGDMLLKNFGVTRHGRVVFYDYDELAWLSECHFREVPKSDNYDDELSAEPWFSIGENDVFPEEFHRFIGLNGPLRQLFIEQHGDLLGINFWKQMQTRLNNGEIIEILPYQENKRLRHKSLAKNLLR